MIWVCDLVGESREDGLPTRGASTTSSARPE